MRSRVVLGTIGTLMKFFSLAFLIPPAAALYFEEPSASFLSLSLPPTVPVFLGCALGSFLVGLLLERIGSTEDFTDKEGFAIVSGGWLAVALVASMPFMLAGTLPAFPDAYFEAMSGLTTTGATVLSYPIEDHAQSVLLWRALLQWLGGMGIIVLGVAVLSRLTRGGRRLMESEAPGPSLNKLKPTIMQTAKLLWLVYVFFTIAEIALLFLADVPIYEAIYHSFTTMSTGGFSIHTDSIAHYPPIVHWIIIAFMVIAGANFTIHYYAVHGRVSEYWRDPEFRFYLLVIGTVTLLMTLNLGLGWGSIERSGRESAFQTVSILTTTGYTTANYDAWPSFSRFMIFILMFMGGCAGSTSGAIKQVRILLMFKMLGVKLKQLLHPNAILHVRLDRRVPEDTLHTVTMFFFAYILIFVVSTAAMLAMGMDMVSGASATASCLGNVGPALGIVGPDFSYAALPEAAKLWLVACMWLGRLEIFTALILLIPTAYKREALLE
jgi:trk system potassium uptake protein TrkH